MIWFKKNMSLTDPLNFLISLNQIYFASQMDIIQMKTKNHRHKNFENKFRFHLF
jgi:hypothetical protein